MKVEREFKKNNSQALKGIAICLMLFHHSFLSVERFMGYSINFYPLSQDRAIRIALFFKICVSIYAFITGYGLMLSYKQILKKKNLNNIDDSKWVVTRIIKTFSGYWIIVALSMIVCQLIDSRTQSLFFNGNIIKGIVDILFNFSGLAYLFGVDLLNGTWWYMSIALLFIISIPILYRSIQKYGYLITGLLIITIPRVLSIRFSSESYTAFIFAVFLGMLCADKNLIVRMANLNIFKNTKNKTNSLIKFFLETILVIILYKVYQKIPLSRFWEINFGLIPMIIIMYLYNFYLELPIIKNILEYLGKHSMNIFLLHTFLRAFYLKDFIMGKGHFLLIFITLLLSSLVLSIILEWFKKIIRYQQFIDYLQSKINKLYDSKKIGG
ncbi:MAG: acyltransferase family protein [Bacilli bacterium]|nr:acyltransferase family protein [Bacilli bacterium]